MENAVYFVTYRLHEGFLQGGNLSNDEIDIVKNSILYWHKKRWFCYYLTVMPNHVHLLVTMLADERLTIVLESVKSYSAHKLNRSRNRTGAVWQREYYDHIIRNESEFQARIRYIFENAIRHEISQNGFDYHGFWQTDSLEIDR